MSLRTFLIFSTVTVLAGCGAQPDEAEREAPIAPCEVVLERTALSPAVREASGVALSRRNGGIFWTHNDSGWGPELFALAADGALTAKIRVDGAANRDWEDLATAPCPAGDCVYIGEIGDNDAVHETVVIYRIPEPSPGDTVTASAERFPMRYADGPRDAEGLFVLPGGEPYIVTKGEAGPVALYRYPPPLRAEVPVTLERIVEIGGAQRGHRDLVTAAGSSPDGRWVAIRSYRELTIYRTEALLRGDPAPVLIHDLSEIGEPQGEGVAIDDDGRVILASEAGFTDAPGHLSILQCTLPD